MPPLGCCAALLSTVVGAAFALDERGVKAVVDQFLGSQKFQDNATAQESEHVIADVDGDRRPDIVLIWNVLGATWWQTKLTLLLDQGRTYRALTANIDGLSEKLSVSGRDIVVDALMEGPNDPRCCPSKKVRLKFQWRGGKLVMLK